MSGISRQRFSGAFANAAIDLENEGVGAALEGTSLDVGKLDALDGKADGRVSGQQALDDLYDAINRLDSHTSGLSSKQERTVWGAMRGATIAPVPISAEQGAALAGEARRMLAEDHPAKGQLSPFATAGRSACENPALSSPAYATPNNHKCNVFVGEAFYRAGLPFPLNPQDHYEVARNLPGQSRFFQAVTIDDVRPGDLVSIWRKDDNGHVEIVSGVERGLDGRIVSITSVGAHRGGLAEGPGTAAPLVEAARANGRSAAVADDNGEIYRILRPMAAPTAGATR